MNARDERYVERYGPWALVTGASDGIGCQIAHELARRGFGLILVARRGDLLETLSRELSIRHEIDCRVVAADLGRADGRAAVLEIAAPHDVGLVVAAAGFGTSGAFIDARMDEERAMLAVNCAAVLELVGHFAPRLARRGRGGIVLLSSVLAFQGVSRAAHYAATKAWVQSFAEGLHAELRGHGVDVLASAPGPVATGFAERARLAMGTTLPPGVVARQTLDALGRRTTTRPGWLSKLLGWSLATLPRPARVLVLGGIMRSMTGRYRGAQARTEPMT